MITATATIAVVEMELPGALAWAARNGHKLSWDAESVTLRCTLTRTVDSEEFFLVGRVTDYPVLPPIWTFTGVDGAGEAELRHFPNPKGKAPCKSWLFIKHHGHGVICAPFNRLSYGPKGPHSGWGDAAHWRGVATEHVQAHEIGLMLAAIDRDLQHTTGRMP